MKDLSINELEEYNGGCVAWNWGLFYKAALTGAGIGASIFGLNMYAA